MPTESRIRIAKPDIQRLFESAPNRIYSLSEIRKIIAVNHASWRLAQSMTAEKFIEFMLDATKLEKVRFEFPNRPIVRYTWGKCDTLEIVQSLKDRGYFTHYTAMRLHGLTEQLPKSVYLNFEQQRRAGGGQLSQAGIDRAFKGKPRTTSSVANFRGDRIHLLNGQNTDELGVIEKTLPDDARLRVTDVERTLIDAAVRPNYSGGVFEVAKAFERAHGSFSVNRLNAYLNKLNFTYPYRQAIGYYLERTGVYDATLQGLLREPPPQWDFYLDYGMRDPDFNERWRLFVPKGF